MNRVAARAGICLLLVALLLFGMVFFLFEYAVNADAWVVFPGSPHVYNGGNIGCGIVTDRDGVVLLNMSDGRIYAQAEDLRKSMVHWLGDRKGNVYAPALSVYSEQLAGYDFLNGLYAYGRIDGTAKLTLSATVQQEALKAFGDYKGTIGVYNYKTGELLCAVSTPNYDPDNPPDISDDTTGKYDGLYVNRFTQSNYVPGSIFKIVTLAAALESIPDIQEQSFICKGSYDIGKDTITCTGKHGRQDIKQAFRNSCNCAFAQIAEQLGKDTLTLYVEQFGVVESLSFDGITTAAGKYDVSQASQFSLAWSSIGQYTDLVNPCGFMTFVGTIAAGGKGVKPYLVESITSDNMTTHKGKGQSGDRIMSAATADIIREFMAYNVSDKYGSDNFPGLTVCAKTGTAEVGGEKKPNAWMTGFVADEEYPLAFVVVVEDGGYGREICMPILSKVLEACKQSMIKNG